MQDVWRAGCVACGMCGMRSEWCVACALCAVCGVWDVCRGEDHDGESLGKPGHLPQASECRVEVGQRLVSRSLILQL